MITTFEDRRPLYGTAALLDWRLNGRLSRFLIKKQYHGNFEEVLLMPSEKRLHAKDILILGLGAENEFDQSKVAAFSELLLDKLNRMKVSDFMLSFSDIISDRFEWRNSVRLLVSKLHDYPQIEMARLCESEDCIRDAKRRHMDFGMHVGVSFETVSV